MYVYCLLNKKTKPQQKCYKNRNTVQDNPPEALDLDPEKKTQQKCYKNRNSVQDNPPQALDLDPEK